MSTKYDPPGAADGHGATDNYDSHTATTTTTDKPLERNASRSLSSYSLIMLLLNLVAAAYLISQQSWHTSPTQISRQLQVQMLQNELETSESQINILRYKMDALESILMKIEKGGRRRASKRLARACATSGDVRSNRACVMRTRSARAGAITILDNYDLTT